MELYNFLEIFFSCKSAVSLFFISLIQVSKGSINICSYVFTSLREFKVISSFNSFEIIPEPTFLSSSTILKGFSFTNFFNKANSLISKLEIKLNLMLFSCLKSSS